MADLQTTLVTGAASGIGAALVRRLAEPGVGLTLHTRRSRTRLEKVAEAAILRGADVAMVLGDLAEPGTGSKIVATHRKKFGGMDHLVANAGFPLAKSLQEMQAKDIAYAFQGNVQSFFELAQAAHPLLAEGKNSRIVGLGSFTAHVFRNDMPQYPASAASKGALEVAVRSLSLALASDKITVNCVVPGYIQKDAETAEGTTAEKLNEISSRIPLGRFGLPDDVAAVIDFLLRPEAGYVSGQMIHVNGGLA